MVVENILVSEFDAEPRLVVRVDEPIDRSEVLRYLGYPKGVMPSARVADSLDFLIQQADALAAPRAIYRVLPIVEKDRRFLRLESPGGTTEFKGAIGEFLGGSLRVAAFIATAGPQVEQQASKLLCKNDDLGAMVLNAVGAERAEAAEAVVIEQLRTAGQSVGLAPTLPYSPGYCGMQLTEQQKLFALFDEANVGVVLTSECLMRPIKSVSGLIGLGPADDILTLTSPCERCELRNCNMHESTCSLRRRVGKAMGGIDVPRKN